MNTRMSINTWIIVAVLLLVLGVIIFAMIYKKEYLTLTSQYSDFVNKLQDPTWITRYPLFPLGLSLKFYTSDSKLYVKSNKKIYKVAITFKGSDAFFHFVDADDKLGKPFPISISKDTLHIGYHRYQGVDIANFGNNDLTYKNY